MLPLTKGTFWILFLLLWKQSSARIPPAIPSSTLQPLPFGLEYNANHTLISRDFDCFKGLTLGSYQERLHNATDDNNTTSDAEPELFLGKRDFQTFTLDGIRAYVADSGVKPDPYYGRPLDLVQFNRGQSTDKSRTQQRKFGRQPFQIVTRGLIGCTVVTVVSRRAVYMGHYWEVPSWGKKADFTRNVINFIAGRTPRVGVGPILDPALFNAPDDDTRIYIMHPRVGEAGGRGGKHTTPTYPGKLQDLKDLLNKQLLPGAATATWLYIKAGFPREGEPDVPPYRRHAIFQYDPVAHGEDMKGWRLFYEDHYFDDTNPAPGPASANGIPDL
ncbi:hypothetical protein APSETT444_007859 [Aspergillus pseudonomiae]